MKTVIIFLLIFCPVISFSQQLNVTSHGYAESSLAERYSITASYPQIDFGPDALMGTRGVAMDINTEIDTLLIRQVNAFRKTIGDISAPCAANTSTFDMSYKTIYSDNGYISFLFDSFANPDCAAHPMTYNISFNYSYLSKGLLTIDSLFLHDSDYLKYISDNCVKELKQKAKKNGYTNTSDMIESGASAKSENFRTFNINNESLIIIFNLYQVAPYVMGIQSVTIPLNGMKKMIDTAGPLAFLFK